MLPLDANFVDGAVTKRNLLDIEPHHCCRLKEMGLGPVALGGR